MSSPPLTLRAAFDAGFSVVAYCGAPGCSGRFITRAPASALDRPIANLVAARAFRCARHPAAPVAVHVNRPVVGVSERVAEYQQP